MTSGDSLVIDELNTSRLYRGQARVGRYPTLDGSVIIDHQGFVTGDRTIQIACKLSEADESTLRTLFENETILNISTKDGFYSGAISVLNGDGGDVEFTILIKEVV